MSPDWSEKPSAIPYSMYDDPQSLNLYGYVRNNPITRVDSDGHCDWCAWQIIQYVATHVGQTGTGMNSTRQEYVQKAKELKASGGTSEQRTQLAQEYRQKGPALGREMAKQEAADPARLAARAAKSESQLAESVGRTSSQVSGTARIAGAVGNVGTGVAIGIAVAEVATAPPGEKVQTAAVEAGGLGGALSGGLLGAEVGAMGGPWGAGLGGLGGAIVGGIGGKAAVQSIVDDMKKPPTQQERLSSIK